jgi:8-oxo-dGTP pyrophosphatase MutT (NUDIX family)
MDKELNKNDLIEALAGSLPGESAQRKMAPEFRGDFKHSDSARNAAVMILIFPYPKLLHTVFIKRNEYPGPHSAQVSFPGGMFELKDENLKTTALRETMEETGIKTEIEVLGSLTPLYIPVSNFCVTPFIGWMNEIPEFDLDPTEVQYLIEVPIPEIFDNRIKHAEIIKGHEIEFMAPYYNLNNEKIWGATAMMLSEFIEVAVQKL